MNLTNEKQKQIRRSMYEYIYAHGRDKFFEPRRFTTQMNVLLQDSRDDDESKEIFEVACETPCIEDLLKVYSDLALINEAHALFKDNELALKVIQAQMQVKSFSDVRNEIEKVFREKADFAKSPLGLVLKNWIEEELKAIQEKQRKMQEALAAHQQATAAPALSNPQSHLSSQQPGGASARSPMQDQQASSSASASSSQQQHDKEVTPFVSLNHLLVELYEYGNSEPTKFLIESKNINARINREVVQNLYSTVENHRNDPKKLSQYFTPEYVHYLKRKVSEGYMGMSSYVERDINSDRLNSILEKIRSELSSAQNNSAEDNIFKIKHRLDAYILRAKFNDSNFGFFVDKERRTKSRMANVKLAEELVSKISSSFSNSIFQKQDLIDARQTLIAKDPALDGARDQINSDELNDILEDARRYFPASS